MGWFDNIGQDNSVIDWLNSGSEKKAQPAADNGEGSKGWATGGWAKATGIAPWAKMFGVGQDVAPTNPLAAAKQGADKDTADSSIREMLLTGFYTKDAPTGGASGKDIATGNGGFEKNDVGGKKDVKGWKDADGKWQAPSYQNWGATGKSFGNRKEDQEQKALGKKTEVSGPPTVWQPDLSKIGNKDDPRSSGYYNKSGVLDKGDAGKYIDEQAKAGKTTGYSDHGSFSSSKYGSYSGYTGLASSDGKGNYKPDGKFSVGQDGKAKGMTLAGWEGQWGAEEKAGWRATAMSANKQHSASAEFGAVASAGASASYGLDTKKGLNAQAGVGGKLGWYGNADADTSTKSVKFGGEDYNLGAGAHGDFFAGAKAGASGHVGIGPEFIGAKGDIGAFAGVEAAGNIHANAGPLSGKVGGSVMAGAGIGADGDISYKDGKFHVGGKMFAALGYGGSLSGDVTVDVGAIGRSAYSIGSDAVDLAKDAGGAIADGASAAYDTAGDVVSSVMSW